MGDSIFSFYMSKKKSSASIFTKTISFGEYTIQVDGNTPIEICKNGHSECIVFGFAVNVIDDTVESIAEYLLSNSNCIESVVLKECALGGKYVIFYRDNDKYFVLCDATSTVPVFYSTGLSNFSCSSNPWVIANELKLDTDEELMKIRKSSDIFQAMPYDVTEYSNIKQLIPNHYLDVIEQKAYRFVNSDIRQKKKSIGEATMEVLPRIEKLVKFYDNKFDIYIPITSGRDSRVVLSFATKFFKQEIKAYTIKHSTLSDLDQDIVVPQKLCAEINAKYERIEDAVLAEEDIQRADSFLGKNKYSKRTLMIAKTVHDHCKDSAIINGDIIGQVGKCSLHRDIPSIFATPRYFRCKLHNYSRGAKKQLQLWMQEIRKSKEKVNVFDLFSVENRLGRWAGQENILYNSIGQAYFNIFNSRSIIYVWTAVKRSKRKKSLLHIDLIEKTNENLLKESFEQDENIAIKLSKANGLFYLLASYLKYYIEKSKFKREK